MTVRQVCIKVVSLLTHIVTREYGRFVLSICLLSFFNVIVLCTPVLWYKRMRGCRKTRIHVCLSMETRFLFVQKLVTADAIAPLEDKTICAAAARDESAI